jgi:hypothetical protein
MNKENFGRLEGELREDKFGHLKSYLQWRQNIFTVANESWETPGYENFVLIANYCKTIKPIYGW